MGWAHGGSDVSRFDVRAKVPKDGGRGLADAQVCRWCSCRPCGHDCPAVLRGESPCPPKTPLALMPQHVQDAVAAKRRFLGMDAAKGEADDDS